MKIAKLLVTFGAISSLVACNKGEKDTSVSRDKFVEAMEALEESDYNYCEATIVLKTKYYFEGYTEAEIEEKRQIGFEDVDINASGVFFKNGSTWSLVRGDEGANRMTYVIGLTADIVYGHYSSYENTKYYLNPMRMKTDPELDREWEYNKCSFRFDEYGYLVHSVGNAKEFRLEEEGGAKLIYAVGSTTFNCTYSTVS